MSSSRIIKAAVRDRHPHPIADFPFGALLADNPRQATISADEFQPLFLGGTGLAREFEPPEQHGHTEEQIPEEAGPGGEELQRLLQEACDRGFADGRREAEESFIALCGAFAEAIEAVNGLRDRIIRESEDDLLKLALMIAKQVVRQEISQDRKILAQFISEATAGLGDHNDIIICFNPEDYRLVTANRQLYLAGVGDKMQITLKPDEQVSIGGCVIETQTGVVDAQVETQLAEIFKRLMQERGHGGSESLELPAKSEQYLSEQCGEKYGYQQD